MARHFVSITNKTYKHFGTLDSAHKDGDLLRGRFAARGFEAVPGAGNGYQDLDKDQLRDALDSICSFAASGRSDLLVVYYAGHGRQDADLYLIPTNGKRPGDRDPFSSYYGYKQLMSGLVYAACPVVLVLDCCRARSGRAMRDIRPSDLDPPTNQVFVLFACAESEQAQDGGSILPSPVTAALDRALESPQPGSIRTVLEDVKASVAAMTARPDPARRRFTADQKPVVLDPDGGASALDWEGRISGGMASTMLWPPLLRHKPSDVSGHELTRPIDLTSLSFEYGVVPFVEPERFASGFEAFMKSDDQFAFATVDGGGGSGKSRALWEFCGQYGGAWTTGFLNYANPNTSKLPWRGWTPPTHALIVLDEAGLHEETALRLLEELKSAPVSNQVKVRVVFIAREIPRTITDAIQTFTWTQSGAHARVEHFTCDRLDFLAARNLYAAALRTFAGQRNRGRAHTRARMRPTNSAYASLNPLDIVLNALWHARSRTPADLGPDGRRRGITRWIWEQVRHSADSAGGNRSHHLFAALATLCGGFSIGAWSDMKTDHGEILADFDATLHARYAGQPVVSRYEPIKPDRVGLAVIYEVMFSDQRLIVDDDKLIKLIEIAWSIAPFYVGEILTNLMTDHRTDGRVRSVLNQVRPDTERSAAIRHQWLMFEISIANHDGVARPSAYLELSETVHALGFTPTVRAINTLIRLAPRATQAADLFSWYVEQPRARVTSQLIESLAVRSGPHVSHYLVRWLDEIKPSKALISTLLERVPDEAKPPLLERLARSGDDTSAATVCSWILYGPDDRVRHWLDVLQAEVTKVRQTFLTRAFSRFGADRFFVEFERHLADRAAYISPGGIQKLLYNDTFKIEHFFSLLDILGARAHGLIDEQHGTIALGKCESYDQAQIVVQRLDALGVSDNAHWISKRARLARESHETIELAKKLADPELRDTASVSAVLSACQDNTTLAAFPSSVKEAIVQSNDHFVLSQFVRLCDRTDFVAVAAKARSDVALLSAHLGRSLLESVYCDGALADAIWQAVHDKDDLSARTYAAYLAHLHTYDDIAQIIDQMGEKGLPVLAMHVVHLMRTAPSQGRAQELFTEFVDQYDESEDKRGYIELLRTGHDLNAILTALADRGIQLDVRTLVRFVALLDPTDAREFLGRAKLPSGVANNLFLQNVEIAKTARDDPKRALALLRGIAKSGERPDKFSVTPILPHVGFEVGEELLLEFGLLDVSAEPDTELFNAWLRSATTTLEARRVEQFMRGASADPNEITYFLQARHVPLKGARALLESAAKKDHKRLRSLAGHILNIQGAADGLKFLKICGELQIAPTFSPVLRLARSLSLTQMPELVEHLHSLHYNVSSELLTVWLSKVRTWRELMGVFNTRQSYPFIIRGEAFGRGIDLVQTAVELHDVTARLFAYQDWLDHELKRLLGAKAKEVLKGRKLQSYNRQLKGHR